jgi:hypothetical protein
MEADTDAMPRVAVIVVMPAVSVVTIPLEPGALLMVATVVSEEAQVTELVRSCPVFASSTLYIATSPNWMDDRGLTSSSHTGVADVTVRVTGAELRDPNVALTFVLPVAALEARPWVPGALLIVATPVVSEAHVTWVLRSWVELSV